MTLANEVAGHLERNEFKRLAETQKQIDIVSTTINSPLCAREVPVKIVEKAEWWASTHPRPPTALTATPDTLSISQLQTNRTHSDTTAITTPTDLTDATHHPGVNSEVQGPTGEVNPSKRKRSDWHVPQNLPKYREAGYEKAEIFVEQLTFLCEAYGIPSEDMVRILPLCLASEDRMWFIEEF